MPYTPPAGNAVGFNFTGSYSPPGAAAVHFDFGAVPPPPPTAKSTHLLIAQATEEEEIYYGVRRRTAPLIVLTAIYPPPSRPSWTWDEDPWTPPSRPAMPIIVAAASANPWQRRTIASPEDFEEPWWPAGRKPIAASWAAYIAQDDGNIIIIW